MPLPGNYSTRTVTGTIVDLHSGGAAAGTVKFTPQLTNQFILDAGANVVIAPSSTEVTLDDNGAFSVVLGTTDDPDINPNGWTYEVRIVTSAENGANALTMTYSVQIPAGAGSLDLADISPAVQSSGSTILVKSVNGVGPDANGNILLVGLLAIMNRNSTFETNANGWEGSGGTVARSTAQAFAGVASLLLTPTGGVAAEARTDLTADGSPSVVVGETYFAAGWVMSPTGYSACVISIDWLNAADAVISTNSSSTVDLIVNRWTYMSVVAPAPLNAVRARIRFRETGTPAAGDLLYIDEAVLTVAQVIPLVLGDLTNVLVPTPANKDVLHYNTSIGSWENSNRLTLLETQPDVQVFTASGTWNKPANGRYTRIQCQAGGGAGGGCAITAAAQFSMGAGGGGGGYAESLLATSLLGTTETVTIGAGGTGAAGAVGGNGGNSSFGAHVVATGGTGGTQQGVVTAPAAVAGGAGGAATAGQIQLAGSDGANSRSGAAGQPASGGAGGSSHMGGARLEPAISTGGSAGNTGKNYGGGGSGGINFASQGTTKAGGNGAGGIVIVTTYF